MTAWSGGVRCSLLEGRKLTAAEGGQTERTAASSNHDNAYVFTSLLRVSEHACMHCSVGDSNTI